MSVQISKLPKLCLVVLIGGSGAGKSSFARKHFAATEIVSSDTCRGWVSDDENSQEASRDAFEILQYLVAIRLRRGLLTVVDATNTRPEDRKLYIELARKYHCLAVAIVFDLPIELSLARNKLRNDRQFGEHIVRNQVLAMRRGLRSLEREGFRYVHVLKSVEQVDAIAIERTKLYNDLAHLNGPFDLIGDVHGCALELDLLLERLGYDVSNSECGHPEGRKAVFVGDFWLNKASTHNPDLDLSSLPANWQLQSGLIKKYVQSYQRYCWPVKNVDDLRLAPFHLLASEGKVHSDQTHLWHMATLAELADQTHIATRLIEVDLANEASVVLATQWWLDMTAAGGEGMVVKPLDFLRTDEKGRAPQPAVKCRGAEYLRIIYGPEYSLPENLTRLRQRSVAGKRSLAFREFALGLEALHRFVEKRPLREVHECVFGVLALESEAVDPRL